MILIRTAKTSELKELHCVKRPFKKKRGKKQKKRREQNQTGDPYGARTFGAASNSIKNPLRGEKKHSLLPYCCTVPLYTGDSDTETDLR